MSAISNIVANLESGNGAYNSSQPSSMVDPTYGQYSGFTSQYGSGAAGVDNYASQVLAHNPNATLGDFYSGYVLGTGNPGSTPGVGALQNQYPAAYSNLVTNSGYSPDTPLATLVGNNAATGPTDYSTGGNTVTDPFSDPTMGGSTPGGAGGVLGLTQPELTATGVGTGLASLNIGLQAGLLADLNTWIGGIATAVGNTVKGWASAAFGFAGDVLIRILVFVAAAILLIIALVMLFKREEQPSGA